MRMADSYIRSTIFGRNPVHFPNLGTFKSKQPLALVTVAIVTSLGLATPAQSQESETGEGDYLAALQQCRAIGDDAARLACFDREAATLLAATDRGDLRIVDREAVRETRRSLFGFSLPKLGIFGGNDDDEDEVDGTLVSEVTDVRTIGRDAFLLTITEGSVWRVSSAPRRFKPRVGDTIELEKAAMSSYWVRLNGQIGVKGRRVE